MAAPIPREPPVTRARRPANSLDRSRTECDMFTFLLRYRMRHCGGDIWTYRFRCQEAPMDAKFVMPWEKTNLERLLTKALSRRIPPAEDQDFCIYVRRLYICTNRFRTAGQVPKGELEVWGRF